MALKKPVFNILAAAEAPPRDSEINSFNANNLICAGSAGYIDRSRRSSIINGRNLYIDREYNCHAVGVQDLYFDNIFEVNISSAGSPFSAKYYSRFLSFSGSFYGIYLVQSSSSDVNGIDLSAAVEKFNSEYSLERSFFNGKYILNSGGSEIIFSKSEAETIASQLNSYLSQNFSSSSISVINGIEQEKREDYFSYINYFFAYPAIKYGEQS
ncbi:MAG: hypothetical protein EBY39_12785, partial [Flavobacteriia bacterium]|nr:hypothetical protein [Flavobacteriia bacterium]